MNHKRNGSREQNREKRGAAPRTLGVVLLCAAVGLTLGIAGRLFRPLSASAVNISSITSDSIREKEEQMAKAAEERKKLEQGLSNLQKIKKELEAERSNLKNYIVKLDANLAEIEARVADLQEQIVQKQAEIDKTQAELDAALAKEEDQRSSLIRRMRMVYGRGETYYLELLSESASFSDFLNKADFVRKIVAYDRKVWGEYKQTREYIALCKEGLDLEKEVLDMTKASVETEQRNLEDLIDQKGKEIANYEKDIQSKAQAIKEYEAYIAEQTATIEALEAVIAAERRKIIESSGKVLTYDGGQFKFPLATYTRISSEFGTRQDPLLGTSAFHNGVDFAAPKGTAIYAAYDGVVVAAAYHNSMGNYVMIDHGDSLYTIYMHSSALYVTKGDVVARGDKIAAVGSTGRSTGNHLHFSVRKDGTYVSPWNYLSP